MPTKEQPVKESYEDVEDRIQEAISSLRGVDEEDLNFAATAREFDVPVRRLRARWKGQPSRIGKPGPHKKLAPDQELAVCLYLDRLDTVGTCARLKMVSNCANTILARAHDDPDTEPPVVGANWATRFLQRHPEYHMQKQSTMDIERTNAHDPEAFLEWFRGYKGRRNSNGIHPRDIYNFDETGFRIGIGKDQWVITRDRTRKTYFGSSTNRELVTVCETISADGDALPPMIILSGVLHQAKWFTKLPDDYLVGVSETGYSNDELSMSWLEHFDKFSARRSIGAYRLLLLDGYGSHCTKEFIDYCDEHNIIPFCLPPHTSHLLQPLDVVVFQPYKHYHAEAVDAAARTACVKYDKVEFLEAIHDIRCQTFKPSTILSAFRKTGLEPYNPEIVLAKMREAAAPPSPPRVPRALLTEPKTPKTVRSLRRLSTNILLDAAARNLSPTFRRTLRTALKGGLAQSQAGQQAFSDLAATTAAERARRMRSRQANIQKGGVLYAGLARSMVKRREELEVKKAEAALYRAQKAQRRAEKAARKPFLDAIKKKQKEIKARYSKRTINWTPLPKREIPRKVVVSEIRMMARKIANRIKLENKVVEVFRY